jgi:hypothetical protein
LSCLRRDECASGKAASITCWITPLSRYSWLQDGQSPCATYSMAFYVARPKPFSFGRPGIVHIDLRNDRASRRTFILFTLLVPRRDAHEPPGQGAMTERMAFPEGWSTVEHYTAVSEQGATALRVDGRTALHYQGTVPHLVFADRPVATLPPEPPYSLYYWEVEVRTLRSLPLLEGDEGDVAGGTPVLALGFATIPSSLGAEAREDSGQPGPLSSSTPLPSGSSSSPSRGGASDGSGLRLQLQAMPGTIAGSLGFFNTGRLRAQAWGRAGPPPASGGDGGLDVAYGLPFGPGDRIGCGWDVQRGHIFFTMNGKMMGLASDSLEPESRVLQASSIFPAIGLAQGDIELRAFFPRGFRFPEALSITKPEDFRPGEDFEGAGKVTEAEVLACVPAPETKSGGPGVVRQPVAVYETYMQFLLEEDEEGAPDAALESDLSRLSVGVGLLENMLTGWTVSRQRQSIFGVVMPTHVRESSDGDWEVLDDGIGTGGNGRGQRGGASPAPPSVAYDSHVLRSVYERCRLLQRRAETRMSRLMTEGSFRGSVERCMARKLDLDDQLARLLSR